MIVSAEKIIFCCALGQFRGPKISELVPGSGFIDGGYTGIARWLRPKSPVERISDLQLFYDYSRILLIVDPPDLDNKLFKCPLDFVQSELSNAQIPWVQYQSAILEAIIRSPDITSI